jgi:predicted O-methyltransferase YrrM
VINSIPRFLKKPWRQKWSAINATVSEVPSLPTRVRRLRHAIARANAEGRPFGSGLGDSADLLYGLVRSMKPETCVEIGSARGKSACYIGLALQENRRGRLYAIDPHRPTKWNDAGAVDTFEMMSNNLAALGVSEYVSVLRAYSEDAARDWSRPIDMVFIDGDHSYEGVKRDWELFVPYVKPFGVVVFHDTIWDLTAGSNPIRSDMGVPRFVEKLRRDGYPVITIDRDCGVSLVQPTVGGRRLRNDGAAADTVEQNLAVAKVIREAETGGKTDEDQGIGLRQ